MTPFVVLNPSAGSADAAALADAIARLPGAVVATAEDGGDATRLAAQAAGSGFDLIVAAGGDGTVSAVVDGLASLAAPPRLGLLPLGTGNDLARTLGIPLDLEAAVTALLDEVERPLDLVEVEAGDGARTHAINVSAGGFSGEVDEAITPERKRRWGPLAYVWTALSIVPEIHPFRTRIRYDGGAEGVVEAINVIVANGRTIGGGRLVAPLANPEDGLLDVVVVRHSGTLDLARVAARLMGGDYLEDDLVTMHRAASVRIDSDPPMPWNADGELVTRAAIQFRVKPGALRVLVGPDYRPDPTLQPRSSP
jgi:diacylglycerol kinase (ATP)